MALPSTLGVNLGFCDSERWRDFKHLITQYTIWDNYLLEIDNLCEIEKINNKYKNLNSGKVEKLEKYFMTSEITKPKNVIYYTSLKEKEEIIEVFNLRLEKIRENDFDYFNKNI